MPAARNWLTSLWAASYKGFPFYFERNDIDGGLDIVVHEFPNSDQNFNEDLGEAARYYSGSAYVTGDSADAQAIAFIAVLVSHGPGLLVLPTDGPVLVRAMRPWKRTAEKDRAGYICFEVKFVREGAAAPLVSVPYLSQVAYEAATSATSALVAAAPGLVAIAGAPEFVAAAAVDTLQRAAAAIDAVRTSYPVAAAQSQSVSSDLQAIANAAAPLLDPAGPAPVAIADFATVVGLSTSPTAQTTLCGTKALAAALAATVETLGEGLDAAIAQDAMASLADGFAPPAPSGSPPYSPSAALAAANVTGMLQLARLAALFAWANAVVGRTYTDRPSAVTARAECAERFERELNHCPGARFAALYLAIEQVQGAVVSYLTQLMANLAPIVEVEAAVAMPSLVAAWRLYQDPTRAVDLALRNQVRHPSFMPLQFQALAPGYAAPGIPTAWPAPPL